MSEWLSVCRLRDLQALHGISGNETRVFDGRDGGKPGRGFRE
jgi:hypothetical protein